MKKITFFICSLASGGAEHQVMELANRLVKNYIVEIITFGNRPDHYTLDPNIIRTRLYKTSHWKTLLTIWNYIFKLKTDVLYLFGQRESKIAIWPLFIRKNFKVWCGERNLNLQPFGILQKICFNLLYKIPDLIIPNSYSQGAFLKNNIIYGDKVYTITNFTDIKKYCYSYHIPEERIKIGVFARYSEQKNYVRALQAVKQAKTNTRQEFDLVWFGQHLGPDGKNSVDYNKFCRIVDDLGIHDNVTPNGAIKDVSSEIKKCDVIMLPSLHEGFSNSISEAICMGKPMIVSDVSDNSLMVKDGVNGFLFNPYDINSIADTIIKITSLPYTQLQQMGLKSRNIAESLFDESKFINKYIEIIEEQK